MSSGQGVALNEIDHATIPKLLLPASSTGPAVLATVAAAVPKVAVAFAIAVVVEIMHPCAASNANALCSELC